MNMKSVNDLAQINKCSGCTACLNVCPTSSLSMRINEKGFLYPEVDTNKCIRCNACSNNCPWLSQSNESPISKQELYSVKRSNFKKRMKSQSGGAFSAYAEYVLKNKGVVYGVAFKNNEAIYCRVTSIRGLKKLKGSKYVQASVGGVFKNVFDDLSKNRTVLFSGTACHVDGLKSFLSAKKADTSKLITIDIICHGVVSPMIFKDYISYTEKSIGKRIKKFNFRDKSFGWHGHFVSFKAGSNYYKSKNYVKIFYSSYALRDTCFECRYANLNRMSDVTIGDSWGIGDYYPDFDDNKGCSLIIQNTDKGKELFNRTKDQFISLKINKNEALQPNLEHPTEKPCDYDNFWQDYHKFGFEYAVFKYCEFNSTPDKIVLKKHQVIKRIVAKIKRIFGF